MEVEFDNIAIINGIEQQLFFGNRRKYQLWLYPIPWDKIQHQFVACYYISAIELETTDGKVYKDVLEVTATGSKGYYLIDEANPASQVVELDNIPAGKYSKITFTVGVDSTGVLNGATGGALDPATSKMFWTGIQATSPSNLKVSLMPSNGGVSGAETVTTQSKWHRFYHIGGWKNIAGTAFVYNNKRISFNFDTDVVVDAKSAPHVHMTFDVMGLIQWSPQSWFHRQPQCAQTIRWGGHGTQHGRSLQLWPYSSVIVLLELGGRGNLPALISLSWKVVLFPALHSGPYGMRTGQFRYWKSIPGAAFPIFWTRSIRLTNFRWPRLVST